MLRMQFYGIVERANAIIDHFRPVARPAILAQPRLGPPLLAKAVFAMKWPKEVLTPGVCARMPKVATCRVGG